MRDEAKTRSTRPDEGPERGTHVVGPALMVREEGPGPRCRKMRFHSAREEKEKITGLQGGQTEQRDLGWRWIVIRGTSPPEGTKDRRPKKERWGEKAGEGQNKFLSGRAPRAGKKWEKT